MWVFVGPIDFAFRTFVDKDDAIDHQREDAYRFNRISA
jgi:hypothetical protein